MFFMGEKKLGRVPPDHDVYMLMQHYQGHSPDEIRQWDIGDKNWLLLYPIAQREAIKEMKGRSKGNG
jgi:hypothetical protein